MLQFAPLMANPVIQVPVLPVLKIVSDLVTAASGIFGLLTEFKDSNNKITRSGEVALAGILVGFFVSGTITFMDYKEAAISEARREDPVQTLSVEIVVQVNEEAVRQWKGLGDSRDLDSEVLVGKLKEMFAEVGSRHTSSLERGEDKTSQGIPVEYSVNTLTIQASSLPRELQSGLPYQEIAAYTLDRYRTLFGAPRFWKRGCRLNKSQTSACLWAQM
jgi:hypothetical protein